MALKPTAPKRHQPRQAQPEQASRFYHIVNPAGAIHECDYEHARWRLGMVGWRLASAEELAELTARSGEQRANDPICEPWSPDPDRQLGLLEPAAE